MNLSNQTRAQVHHPRNITIPQSRDRTYGVVLDTALRDQIRNLSSVGKSGNVLSDLVESQDGVFAVGPHELSLALVTNDDNRAVGVALLGEGAARGFRDGRVDTTAETLVGGDNDEELLAALGSLGVAEDL